MVDIHQQGDHRIILGESLKDGSSSHIGVKYNWVPKEGFNHSPGIIRGTKDDLKLAYDGETAQYDYTGWLSEQPEDTQLALFYDQEQSVYVLEKLAASLSVNIKSGSNLSSDYIKRHAQLPKSPNDPEVNGNQNNSSDLFEDGEDDSPDSSNPFDYRNFLEEAKEATEKQSSRTPLPGGRTPMSGLSSPLNAGGHIFSSTTPQFGPIEIKPSSKGPKEEYPDRQKRNATTTTSTKSRPSRKAQSSTRPRTTTQSKRPQALSKEKVLDSDSEDDASADMSDRPSPVVTLVKKPTNTKTHHRNVSSTSFASASHSPRITINDDDDDGGLEIDTGSPPPETRKRNYRIDPEAFRSQTGTPRLALGGNANRSGFDERPRSRDTNADIEMRDAEEDEAMKYLQSDDEDAVGDVDRNGDVDELLLDDPGARAKSPTSPPLPKLKAKRRQSSAMKSHGRRPRAPSPPALQQSGSMEDDDGGLAAELEAALEREQMEQEEARMQGQAVYEEEEGGIGLGIGHDEEEVISEEE